MPLFRFHRGGLAESLKTTIIVKNVNELVDVIRKYHETWGAKNLSSFEIFIEPYPDKNNNFDPRIGWYTQIVQSNIHDKDVFHPEGYLSEPMND
jgi:hypothetical protein